MNILIKLTCLVGLVIAPILGGHGIEGHATAPTTMHQETIQKEVSVNVETVEGTETMKATITVTTTKDGQTTEFVELIEGTKEEIAAVVAKRKGVDVKITSENEE